MSDITQSQLMSNLVTIYGSLQEFLVKLSQSTTSFSDYTAVDWIDQNGNAQTINIPSLGFMKSDIDILKSQLETLISNNGDSIVLQYNDGTVKSFDMVKISSLIDTLNSVDGSQFTIPSEFRAKSNWFFESFLNPLLVTSVNISQFLTDSKINRFAVRRVIVTTNTANDITFFDNNFKGKNNIVYDDAISILSNAGASYNIDDNEYDLPSAINKHIGNFNVLQITQSTSTVDGSAYPIMYYTLDKLFYTDIINNKNGNTFLAVNDILLTSDDTEYVVLSIDKSTNRVLLQRTFGSSSINVGVGVLKIYPQIYRIPELQINIGYNERELIFIKPISDTFNLTTNSWSNGFGLFTNELSIIMSDNSVTTLDNFYTKYVSDFGLIMLNFAKEKQIPAILGLKPNSPVLTSTDFTVVNVNDHITDTNSINDFKTQISNKEALQNQLDEINKSINENKAKLNNSATSNNQTRLTIQKTINDLNTTKAGVQKQLTTILDQLALNINTNPNLTYNPEYRVRGFTAIPDPRVSEYGTQDIVQMVYAYRYSSKSGNATNNQSIPFTDANGNTVSAYFSNWNEVVSKQRLKVYNDSTGTYTWAVEDVQNPDTVNINQVDIPITKGEQVEIRIKAISEAGYPVNPIESDWSNSVIIQFPDSLELQSEQSALAENILIEDALVGFQNELNSRGLDVHLSDSIITGDKYYAHILSSISSGLYDANGTIINSYDLINTILNRLNTLEGLISKDTAQILITITNRNTGEVISVKQGDTVDLFAGYYKDLIGANDGAIESIVYTIDIQNTAGNILELVSYFGGGIGQEVLTSTSDYTDYGNYRKYDLCPILVSTNDVPELNDYKQIAGYQSKQVMSQFIYTRYMDYAKSTNVLYGKGNNLQIGYNYNGITLNSHLIPSDGVKYLPYAPAASSSTNDIWSGVVVSGVPQGSGTISEFCIHKNHPALIEYYNINNSITSYNKGVFEPTILPNANQPYMPFSHGLNMETSVEDKTNLFGFNYYQQCQYVKETAYVGSPEPTTDSTYYPTKIGFIDGDEYLIGKYTCGSYLSLSPNSYNDISIQGNHPELAKVQILNGSQYAISIPVVFQFRCTDKLGYVGGYRNNGDVLKNITYKKKIGIDIYQKLHFNSNKFDAVFSFDLTVSCKYKQDVASNTLSIPNTIGLTNTTYIKK